MKNQITTDKSVKRSTGGLRNVNLAVKSCASLVAILFITTACNKVGFSPTPDEHPFVVEPSPSPTFPPQPSPEPTISPSPGQKITETFTQEDQAAKEDILIIDDNSKSMYEEQKKLGSRLNSFLDSLDNIDWQIGITTTDVSTGRYGLQGSLIAVAPRIPFLTPNTPFKSQLFYQTITREETLTCDSSIKGDCPDYHEQPLKATILAMRKKETVNAGFFRNDAGLVVIVLSDENENSEGGPSATTADQVISAFKSTFDMDKRFSVYGIIIQSGDKKCHDFQTDESETEGTFYGTFVEELARKTGGLTSSICDTDYSKGLSKIGQRIRKLVNTVSLKHKPKEKTIEIEFTPDSPQTSWTLKGNQIVFNNPPPKGTKIEITYEAVE